jgi:predicted 3-demethylubiquinone-9 3-methyltransferase (glyoxalase superfamily)
MQKIIPFLWFDNQAESAVDFYVSIFKNSRIIRKTRYGKAGFEHHHMPAGSVMTVEFELEGRRFCALNGGPFFSFNESVSFTIACRTQREIDYYWTKLSADPAAEQCGWLKDKFGLSWQITPSVLSTMLCDPDTRRSQRVMKAVLKMRKIEIAELKRAFAKK